MTKCIAVWLVIVVLRGLMILMYMHVFWGHASRSTSFVHAMTHSDAMWLIQTQRDSFRCSMSYPHVHAITLTPSPSSDWWFRRCRSSRLVSFVCVKTHSHVTLLFENSFICVTTHSYVSQLIRMCQDAYTCDIALWELIHMCHNLFICVTTHSYVSRRIHMWHCSLRTHSYVSQLIHVCHNSFVCVKTQSHVTWRTLVRLLVQALLRIEASEFAHQSHVLV